MRRTHTHTHIYVCVCVYFISRKRINEDFHLLPKNMLNSKVTNFFILIGNKEILLKSKI